MGSEKNLITLETIVSRQAKLPTANLGDEIGLMNIEKGKYYGMDSVGSRIWHLLEEPLSVKELIKLLIEEYEVSYETCKDEVLEYLNLLADEGLINL